MLSHQQLVKVRAVQPTVGPENAVDFVYQEPLWSWRAPEARESQVPVPSSAPSHASQGDQGTLAAPQVWIQLRSWRPPVAPKLDSFDPESTFN